MKKLNLLLVMLFVVALTLSACSGKPSESLAGNWKLVSYGSVLSPTPAVPNVGASVTFGAGGKLTGNVGCNGFGGDYKVSGNQIAFGPIVSTMMACADPVMQQESATLKVLSDKSDFKINGNTLTLTSADGNSLLVFAKK